MREIKFRFYTPDIGYMKPWCSIKTHTMDVFDTANDVNDIFMQYTGFKDSNGIEIYEDDVICVRCYGENFNYKVIWEAGGWRAKGNYGQGWWLVDLINQEPNDPVKVIGNKHENEELWESILGGEPFYGTEEDENWYDESSSFDWEEE